MSEPTGPIDDETPYDSTAATLERRLAMHALVHAFGVTDAKPDLWPSHNARCLRRALRLLGAQLPLRWEDEAHLVLASMPACLFNALYARLVADFIDSRKRGDDKQPVSAALDQLEGMHRASMSRAPVSKALLVELGVLFAVSLAPTTVPLTPAVAAAVVQTEASAVYTETP
jgi:hypothetical protein